MRSGSARCLRFGRPQGSARTAQQQPSHRLTWLAQEADLREVAVDFTLIRAQAQPGAAREGALWRPRGLAARGAAWGSRTTPVSTLWRPAPLVLTAGHEATSSKPQRYSTVHDLRVSHRRRAVLGPASWPPNVPCQCDVWRRVRHCASASRQPSWRCRALGNRPVGQALQPL